MPSRRDDPNKHKWREKADPRNLELLRIYAAYLIGQFAGMSRALSLDAVRAAMEIEAIDREEWPDMTERLVLLHAAFVETLPK